MKSIEGWVTDDVDVSRSVVTMTGVSVAQVGEGEDLDVTDAWRQDTQMVEPSRDPRVDCSFSSTAFLV